MTAHRYTLHCRQKVWNSRAVSQYTRNIKRGSGEHTTRDTCTVCTQGVLNETYRKVLKFKAEEHPNYNSVSKHPLYPLVSTRPGGTLPRSKELSRHRAVVQVVPRRIREQASRDDRQPLRQAERVRVGARQRGRARLEPLAAAQEVEADRDARRRGRARRAAGAPVNRVATPCLGGSKAVQSATLEAARSRTRGTDGATAFEFLPGSVKPPRAVDPEGQLPWGGSRPYHGSVWPCCPATTEPRARGARARAACRVGNTAVPQRVQRGARGTHGVCREVKRDVRGGVRRCCGGGGGVWGGVGRWDTEGTHGAQRPSCGGCVGRLWDDCGTPPSKRGSVLTLVILTMAMPTRRLQVEAQLERLVVVAEQRGPHVSVGPAVGEVAVEGAGDDHHAAVVSGHLGQRQPHAQERGGT